MDGGYAWLSFHYWCCLFNSLSCLFNSLSSHSRSLRSFSCLSSDKPSNNLQKLPVFLRIFGLKYTGGGGSGIKACGDLLWWWSLSCQPAQTLTGMIINNATNSFFIFLSPWKTEKPMLPVWYTLKGQESRDELRWIAKHNKDEIQDTFSISDTTIKGKKNSKQVSSSLRILFKCHIDTVLGITALGKYTLNAIFRLGFLRALTRCLTGLL